ncbi:erythromycin esterase family protein [Tellurirhabdus rosea]|uniref:erythromycin esterase family protein n=1 Tax=Tellurirhabdus rosea TaxID=2674997 RepID=UPI00224E1E80|nr:erythromycin esterase family protein [Tellurirhabdus rosea]
MKKLPIVLFGYFLSSLNGCRQETVTARGEQPDAIIKALQSASQPLTNEDDLDSLMRQIGDARYVLLGEASHGTAEFYTWRATITKRLIQEKGFTFVAVEGDWPDAYELNQYIRGAGSPDRARDVLRAFDRWPTWMWANEEVASLADWMRTYNDARSDEQKASFYGLDVYSLWESMDRLRTGLQNTDPQAAALAQEAARCLAVYRGDEQAYALGTLRGQRCAPQLTQLLERLRAQPPAGLSALEQFNLEQNALVAVNGERYYYAMVRDDAESWNVRDRHMAETLDRLMRLHGPNAKAIVWAHNTHVGDAQHTDMAEAGMVNLGQLVRESHGTEGVHIVGFGTYEGEVIAANRWGAPLQRMPVPKAARGSWADLLHTASAENKLVSLQSLRQIPELRTERGQRAIGVVYNPNREAGNYVPTDLTQRYDSFIFIDRTKALNPLPVPPEARKEHSNAPVGSYALIND